MSTIMRPGVGLFPDNHLTDSSARLNCCSQVSRTLILLCCQHLASWERQFSRALFLRKNSVSAFTVYVCRMTSLSISSISVLMSRSFSSIQERKCSDGSGGEEYSRPSSTPCTRRKLMSQCEIERILGNPIKRDSG